MATRKEAMELELKVKNAEAKKKLKEFSKEVDKTAGDVKKSGKKIETSSKKAAKGVMSLGKAIGIAAAAGGLLIAARKISQSFRVMTGVMSDSIDAATEQQRVEEKLAQSLVIVGAASDDTVESLKKRASAMQDLTGIGDEVILANQSLLISMGKLSGEGLDRATKAALDLAAANETLGLSSAVDLIAKAAVGYTSTLSRYGIILDQSIPKSEKFAAALAKIEDMSSGQAAAALRTYGGRLAELSGRWDDLQEAIGSVIVDSPAVRDLLIAVSEAVKTLTLNLEGVEFESFLRSGIEGLGTIAKGLVTAGETAAWAAANIRKVFGELRPGQTRFELWDEIDEDLTNTISKLEDLKMTIDDVFTPKDPVEIAVIPGTEGWDTWLARLRGEPVEVPIVLQPPTGGTTFELPAEFEESLKTAGVKLDDTKSKTEAAAIALEMLGSPEVREAIAGTGNDIALLREELEKVGEIELKFDTKGLDEAVTLLGRDAPRELLTLEPAPVDYFDFQAALEEYLDSRVETQLASLDREYELKAARIIAGEGMLTSTALEMLRESGIEKLNITEEQYAALEELARTHATKVGRLEGSTYGEKKKLSDMEVKDKRRTSLEIARTGTAAASKAFEDSKGMRIAGAIANTAAGIVNMMGFQPPNAAPFMMAFAAATGAAQIAKIASQKAARGFMVRGGTPGTDSVHIAAMEGEAVIPRSITSELMNFGRTIPAGMVPQRPDASGLPPSLVRALSYVASMNSETATAASGAFVSSSGVPNAPSPVAPATPSVVVPPAVTNNFEISIESPNAKSFQEMLAEDPEGFASVFIDAVALKEI